MKYLLALAIAVSTVWSFYIPPASKLFQQPQLARIFVWHFPCPMIATVLLLVAGWSALMYFRTQNRAWDERAVAAAELSFIFSLLTMATGMLFSKIQWGAWWSWDPRQTSFLIVLFIYAAYFVVRGAFHDPERRASNSGAYLLSALLPTLFLIFGLKYLPQMQGLHPDNSIISGNIKGEYAYSVTANMVTMGLLSVWLYRLRVRAGLLEIDYSNERLAIRGGDSASSGVVRPVSVPPEG